MVPMFYSIQKDAILLRVRVVPNSSNNEVLGLYGDRLKIKLNAPPEDGKANKALIEFLAEILDIKKSSISLVRGDTSRTKDLLISNILEIDIQKLVN